MSILLIVLYASLISLLKWCSYINHKALRKDYFRLKGKQTELF